MTFAEVLALLDDAIERHGDVQAVTLKMQNGAVVYSKQDGNEWTATEHPEH